MSSNSHIKYISFVNSTKYEMIGSLQLNKYMNIKVRDDCLEDISVLDKIEGGNNIKTISEIFLNTKYNRISLHR